MPVRLLSSSVLRWPDARAVDAAARRWACQLGAREPGIARIGYCGSYARGDWGVGSDLDLVIVVEESSAAPRASAWDTTALPVPTDVLVSPVSQWGAAPAQNRMARMLRKETIWVYVKEDRERE